MEDGFDRINDESMYQQWIYGDRIRSLYEIKEVTGKPMTVLLDQAILDLATRYEVGHLLETEADKQRVGIETWDEICEYRKRQDRIDYLKCLVELEKLKSNEQGRKTD